MAILKGKQWIGKIFNIIIREQNGQIVGQSQPAPKSVKQTKATVQASRGFGRATRFGAMIRRQFEPLINDCRHATMHSDLSGLLNKLLDRALDKKTNLYHFTPHSFEGLSGFNFQQKSPLEDQLLEWPDTAFEQGILRITLPELQVPRDLKFPQFSRHCTLTLSIRCFALADGYHERELLPQHSVEIPVDVPIVPEQEFSFPVPEGCLAIAAICLRYSAAYYNMPSGYNHKNFNPAAIIAAVIHPGSFSYDKKRWSGSTVNEMAFGEGALLPAAQPAQD